MQNFIPPLLKWDTAFHFILELVIFCINIFNEIIIFVSNFQLMWPIDSKSMQNCLHVPVNWDTPFSTGFKFFFYVLLIW